jgi:predicted AAA+ superfamily ATPase
MKTNYINRPVYTDKIKPFIGKQIIKVLTGQRRVGKSTIMLQLMDFIFEENPTANIIYINRELEQFAHIRTNIDLNEYLLLQLKDNKPNFLFIDEIQEIESFQLTFRSLLSENKCDIFCTGSNAKMLSGELATFLAGRYIEFNIHSLSFIEFLDFHQLEAGNESLMKYLTFGGLPFLYVIGLNDFLPFEYLKNVYSTILLKDVVTRENIRNIPFLENLVFFLADNIGNLFSATNISKFLKSQRIEISTQLTINYLKALSNAYFVHKVIRSEVSGLKIFEIGEKYYFEDLGLRNSIKGFNQKTDIARIIENAVFLHLLYSGYRIYAGKIDDKEIDFVADKNGLKIYVQVCLQVTVPATASREFGNLLMVHDNYPKYVITFNDPMIGNDYLGIKHLNLLDFLLLKL